MAEVEADQRERDERAVEDGCERMSGAMYKQKHQRGAPNVTWLCARLPLKPWTNSIIRYTDLHGDVIHFSSRLYKWPGEAYRM